MSVPDRLGIDTDAMLARALAAAGLTACRGGMTRIGGGVDNMVFATESNDGCPLIVKVRRHHRRARYDVAAWAASQLATAGVPTPQILWHDQDVCIETRCPGRPLASVDDKPSSDQDLAAVTVAGELLRRLHTVPVRGFGRLDPTGTGTHQSLRAWLLHPSPACSSTTDDDLLALTQRVRRVLRVGVQRLPEAPPRLLHGDWTARHVLAESGCVTGVVDLESARGGDPLADVAGWSLQEPPPITAALLTGYFSHIADTGTLTTLVLHRLRIATSLLCYHAAHGNNDQTCLLVRQIEADLEDLSADEPALVPRIPPAPALPHVRSEEGLP